MWMSTAPKTARPSMTTSCSVRRSASAYPPPCSAPATRRRTPAPATAAARCSGWRRAAGPSAASSPSGRRPAAIWRRGSTPGWINIWTGSRAWLRRRRKRASIRKRRRRSCAAPRTKMASDTCYTYTLSVYGIYCEMCIYRYGTQQPEKLFLNTVHKKI